MRIYFILSCVLFAASAFGGRQREDTYSIDVVKRLLIQPKGFSTGFAEKQANRLGDRVSIALLKIFTEEELMRPQNVAAFLPLIRSSFLSPNLISIEEDRKPDVTLFLLSHLERTVKSPSLGREISQLIVLCY